MLRKMWFFLFNHSIFVTLSPDWPEFNLDRLIKASKLVNSSYQNALHSQGPNLSLFLLRVKGSQSLPDHIPQRKKYSIIDPMITIEPNLSDILTNVKYIFTWNFYKTKLWWLLEFQIKSWQKSYRIARITTTNTKRIPSIWQDLWPQSNNPHNLLTRQILWLYSD